MVRSSRSTKNDPVDLFVPGRLCLFGEHTDWAAEYGIHPGFCIVIGTDQGISATAEASDQFIVETPLCDGLGKANERARRLTCHWDRQSLLEVAQDQTEFFRYCAGVAHEVLTRLNISTGIDIQMERVDLPLKRGVSSSAAVCVLMAKAFNAVYKLGMFPGELMELAYVGERLTGSQCGRMDQACIYGKTPVLLTCERNREIRVEPIVAGHTIHMFFVDLAGEKDTVEILGKLNDDYPKSKDLQQVFGKENERLVRKAYQAIEKGDAEQLGTLMSEAQHNFDKLVTPHCPSQLASPLLHKVLSFEGIAEHIYGGKGVGSQGDGTAQFVARSLEDQHVAMTKIEAAFPQMRCFPLTVSETVNYRVTRLDLCHDGS